MNFYVAVVAIGMCVSMTQADYTYTIKGSIGHIEGLRAQPVACSRDTRCWTVDWQGDDKYQIGAQVEVFERDGRTPYSNVENSTLVLCKSYDNDTWEEAIRSLLVEALFPSNKKTCPLNGLVPYLLYEKMDPVTITLRDMLDCNDFAILAHLYDDYSEYEGPDPAPENALGDVVIMFTIPDNGNCNKQ